MNYAIVNLGCKVNRVESDSYATQLRAAGWSEADVSAADVIVVNTCTVTGEAEKKTRKTVRRVVRQNDTAPIYVTGCAAAIDATTYEAMSPTVRVVPKADMDAILDDYLYSFGTASDSAANSILPVGEGFRTRVGVKVQDGCNNACTYCIVHVARGFSSSRNFDDIVAESVALAKAGVFEIVLTGINLGSYNWHGKRLHHLLEELLAQTADCVSPSGLPVRFRVSSVEPTDVHPEFIELLAASNGRICRHLHLPLQAGSSKVLREMNRPYTAEEFKALVDRLYEAVPTLSLSTDIICGFPGETDEEFEETMALAAACRFSKIHVFPYSIRRGTPAAERKDQVAPEVKTERTHRLIELSDQMRAADLASRRGTEEALLIEETGIAVTESYHEIAAAAEDVSGDLRFATL